MEKYEGVFATKVWFAEAISKCLIGEKRDCAPPPARGLKAARNDRNWNFASAGNLVQLMINPLRELAADAFRLA